MRRFFFLVALLALSGTAGSECIAANTADTASNSPKCWVNLGLGFGGWRGETAGTLGAGVSVSRGNELFTLRFLDITRVEFRIFGPSHPDDNMWEVGVLYGRIAKARYGFASISAGLAFSSAATYSDSYYTQPTGVYTYDANSSVGIGIPIEGQLFWTPTDFFGVGLTGFGDYAFGETGSFWGVAICLQFGLLR